MQSSHKVAVKQDRHAESVEYKTKKKSNFVRVGLVQSEENWFVTHVEREGDYCVASIFYLGPPGEASDHGYSVSIRDLSESGEGQVLALYGGVANPVTLSSDNECSGLLITKDLMLMAKLAGHDSKVSVEFSLVDFRTDDFNGDKALAEAKLKHELELDSLRSHLADGEMALTKAKEDHRSEVESALRQVDELETALDSKAKDYDVLNKKLENQVTIFIICFLLSILFGFVPISLFFLYTCASRIGLRQLENGTHTLYYKNA